MQTMGLRGFGPFSTQEMDRTMRTKIEAKIEVTGEGKVEDRSALLLMLAYVEAECRRLGAEGAAKHAAMAAALVPDQPRLGLSLH